MTKENSGKTRRLSSTQIIMLSFLLAILIGTILLSLPISSANGRPVPIVDALFMATTSVCVTGLVTMPTVSTWSIFGQIVILILIQIGGLGVVTIICGLMISLHRRIGIGSRTLIQDAFNLNSMSGLVKFTKKVLLGTFLVEAAGALAYCFVFVPEFGPRGIWISVFNSISAFCNAGIDILGENSLCDYVLNPVVNLVTCALIVSGGIGYIVWWELLNALKDFRKKKLRVFQSLSLHCKIALVMTGFLIVLGTVLFFIFEYHNPETIGGFSLPDKLLAAFFQSVTTRTAGFATIPQENLSNASALTALVFMFIGGSPIGTAGGVKTVTMAVLMLAAFATIRGEDEVNCFGRRFTKEAISKAVAVVGVAFLIAFLNSVALAAVTDAPAIDILYETVSATATVGLSRNLTASLNIWGKLIIICTMYLGRVGPISLMIAFNKKSTTNNIVKNPVEKVSVG